MVARMYQKALTFEGHEVEFAVGGREGISKAEEIGPDLVLLDVMMPEPDGMTVLKTLKSKDSTKDIPVILLTNLSAQYDKDLAKEYGASDYWVKSDVDYKKLGEKITEFLNGMKGEDNKQ